MLLTSIRSLVHPSKPIGDIKYQPTSLGEREKNAKFGWEGQVVVPVSIPPNMLGVAVATVTQLTSSVYFSGSSGVDVTVP